MRRRWLRRSGAAVVCAAVGLGAAFAQAPGFTRTELQRADLGVPGREVVVVRVDFAPGGSVGRHTHFGDEVAYVLDGSLVLEVEGKAPRVLHAGEVAFIPAGTVHAAHTEAGPAHLLASYIVEKGKPLAAPAK